MLMKIIAILRILILCLVGLALISCASISPREQVRISADLKDDCYRLYGSNTKNPVTGQWDYVGMTGFNRVFAVGNFGDRQACAFSSAGVLASTHEELAVKAINTCNQAMPGGTGCQIYAIDSNIVYSPYATQASSTPMSRPTINSNPPPATSNSISIKDAKSKCSDLGFKTGTEDFGKCVLKLTK